MIIDMHTHIGTVLNFNMPGTMLVESMDKYQIDFSLLSNIEGSEGDHQCNRIPEQLQKSQTQVNNAALELAKKYPTRLGVCLWAKALTEGCTEEFEKMIIENRSYIYGIKVHPFHGLLSFLSPQVEEYVKLAQKYHLPILTHTAKDDNSDPRKVYEMAIRYPDVKFVMAHLGLGSDNSLAMQLVRELPNLYGDTAWVLPERILKFIRQYGADKILFGSDNPIDGVDTYDHPMFYRWYLNDLKTEISKEDYEKLMYKNAIDVFQVSPKNSSK